MVDEVVRYVVLDKHLPRAGGMNDQYADFVHALMLYKSLKAQHDPSGGDDLEAEMSG